MSTLTEGRISRLVAMVSLAAVVLLIDQLTKAWLTTNMATHDTRPIIEGFVRLRYTENSGAAFGLFQGWTGVLSIAAAAIITAIVLSASRFAGNSKLLMLAIGLVLGGALGNLVDRLTLGHVRDFIDVYGPHIEWNGVVYTWPVFNVADSAISIGVVILMVSLVFGQGEGSPYAETSPDTPVTGFETKDPSPSFRAAGRTGTDD